MFTRKINTTQSLAQSAQAAAEEANPDVNNAPSSIDEDGEDIEGEAVDEADPALVDVSPRILSLDIKSFTPAGGSELVSIVATYAGAGGHHTKAINLSAPLTVNALASVLAGIEQW